MRPHLNGERVSAIGKDLEDQPAVYTDNWAWAEFKIMVNDVPPEIRPKAFCLRSFRASHFVIDPTPDDSKIIAKVAGVLRQ